MRNEEDIGTGCRDRGEVRLDKGPEVLSLDWLPSAGRGEDPVL